MLGKVIQVHAGKRLVIFQTAGIPEVKPGDDAEIKKKRPRRSLNQNALYWLFCQFVGNALFMEKEEVHSGFSIENLKKVQFFNGRRFEILKSTTDLTPEEFSAYLEHCNLTALEMGVDTAPFWKEYEDFWRIA